MKYTLYNSVDDLIALETLHKLTGIDVTSVRCTPLEGGGFTGSRLQMVETNGDQGQRLVLKQMGKQTDWTMQASNDDYCRSVTLWEHGLLDQLQPAVDHAILACARDGDGWAILMSDISVNLMNLEAWSEAEIKVLLDAMVAMHVTFWEAPQLNNPATGLCDTDQLIQTFSVDNARRLPSNTSPIPGIITEGWELLQEWLEPDVAGTLADLQADPQPLAQALARYPVTLVHGDYRAENLALQPMPGPPAIVLDWQLAARSAPTVDLSWFLTKPQVLRSSLSIESGVDYYRKKLEQHLGNRFDPMQWQPMLELGVLVDILRIGVFRAWFDVHTTVKENRVVERELLKQHNAQVRAALRWL